MSCCPPGQNSSLTAPLKANDFKPSARSAHQILPLQSTSQPVDIVDIQSIEPAQIPQQKKATLKSDNRSTLKKLFNWRKGADILAKLRMEDPVIKAVLEGNK
jgi:glutamate mutase epsilon subunit